MKNSKINLPMNHKISTGTTNAFYNFLVEAAECTFSFSLLVHRVWWIRFICLHFIKARNLVNLFGFLYLRVLAFLSVLIFIALEKKPFIFSPNQTDKFGALCHVRRLSDIWIIRLGAFYVNFCRTFEGTHQLWNVNISLTRERILYSSAEKKPVVLRENSTPHHFLTKLCLKTNWVFIQVTAGFVR